MSRDGHKFFQPHFKPDYNPDLLCTVNYICHLFVVDRKVIEQVGTLRKEFDGAQDYDFIFRCIEAVSPEEICHVPKILYHWRCHEESTAKIRRAKLMHLNPGSVRLKSTTEERVSTQKYIRESSWGSTGQDFTETMIH